MLLFPLPLRIKKICTYAWKNTFFLKGETEIENYKLTEMCQL